jgi:hypothetical protein
MFDLLPPRLPAGDHLVGDLVALVGGERGRRILGRLVEVLEAGVGPCRPQYPARPGEDVDVALDAIDVLDTVGACDRQVLREEDDAASAL